jgi:MraZ protein
VFIGRYEYAIDDKSRVSIPSKFRDTLLANYDMRLILNNLDGCIVAFPYQEWVEVKDQISKQGSRGPEARNTIRKLFAGASECSIDRLGRVLIPQLSKTRAGIKKDVVIIGVNRKIEIWAKEAFEELERSPGPGAGEALDIWSEVEY